jgi:NAD(P)H dehydrogenase (quinone)
MRKLLITAHPNPNGFTHKIANTFFAVSEDCGHEVRIINLYDSDLRQDFLILDAKNKPTNDPHISYMQEQITWAEELIFIYPVWWYDAPAILKNWFDVNLASGFAYKYKDN